MDNLPKGHFLIGSRLMCECDDCGKIVQVNKRFFGSLHVCSQDELQPNNPNRGQHETHNRRN